ncbi:hypothetical protein [Streptomyces sp. NPDC056921]|uniref:hypothetical protein n=1 Tax=Streptomyces sp. NPDC056921 TaxID=3345966 RepID=UPI00362638AA
MIMAFPASVASATSTEFGSTRRHDTNASTARAGPRPSLDLAVPVARREAAALAPDESQAFINSLIADQQRNWI